MADFNDPFMRNKDAAVQARTKAANRANVLQLKMMGQGHPTGLTPNLLKLFEARPPLEYKPPPEKKKCPPYAGMAQFVSHFAEPGDAEYAPPVKEGETKAQKKARIHKLKLEKGAAKSAEDLEKYDPSKDLNISGDPYKTLFVAKLSYETTEHRLKREFEAYGPIKRFYLEGVIRTMSHIGRYHKTESVRGVHLFESHPLSSSKPQGVSFPSCALPLLSQFSDLFEPLKRSLPLPPQIKPGGSMNVHAGHKFGRRGTYTATSEGFSGGRHIHMRSSS